jgi:DNA-binding transcriptional ArsR family regulator
MKTIHPPDPLDALFMALSNEKRRNMIHELSLSPVTIGMLARRHALSLPAIHKHIRILENAELIIRRKTGRTNFVALEQKSLALAQKWLAQYRTEWGASEASLDNYIARMQE